MSRCICEFSPGCAGLGVIYCDGCGGDFCVCAACFGRGEIECPGCPMCASEGQYGDDDPDDESEPGGAPTTREGR